MNYLFLQNPGHNRVYYLSADKLALAELKIAGRCLSVSCSDFQIIDIEGIRYLSLDSEDILSENDLQILSRLSFVFAIYKREKPDTQGCLIPVKKADYEYVDNKISTLLKYSGKTNELFTRMMLNVAVLSSDFDYGDRLRMLDPVAGKGTSLFEGIVNGFDTYGIELKSNVVHEATVFFKKYLETERLKHISSKRQIYGTNKHNGIDIQEFEYARTKEEFKSGDSLKKMGFVCGNAQDAFKYFKKEWFHLIVGDLPYGIVHGNSGKKRTTSPTRNPSELLTDCLPEWAKVLKIGGTIVIAWNAFLVSREKMIDIFENKGFDVLSHPPYDEFEHRVDSSIKRDIIVAKKA